MLKQTILFVLFTSILFSAKSRNKLLVISFGILVKQLNLPLQSIDNMKVSSEAN